MLVTINPKFKGIYGHYVENLGTVVAKRAGCEPFDEDPMIAKRQISRGVMVAVDPAAAPFEPEAVEEPKAEPFATSHTEVVDEPVDDVVDEADDLESLSITELRAEAKERGISSFGVKKATLIDMIREFDSKEAPDLGAMDPV